MSWLYQLYQTYEANSDEIGEIAFTSGDKEYTLLPISHTTQTAHIEVTVTEDGEFYHAKILDKESTVIPTTEDSSSRSGKKIAPYPLHDKLSYVGGDFGERGGTKEPFEHYIKQLEEWVNSPFTNAKVKSIYLYLSKKQLIADLAKEGIIALDENGNIIEKWHKKYENLFDEKPAIFSAVTDKQTSAFVRFNVYSPHDILEDVWKDKEVYQSYVDFYQTQLDEVDYCYVTGEQKPITERHANKIRNAADKAKIISSNDKTGYTFRGRFQTSSQAASISYEASQKAHNALKWLIQKQGIQLDGRVFLVWGNSKSKIIDPIADTYALTSDLGLEEMEHIDTLSHLADEVKKAIYSYRSDLSTKENNVNILILDAATTGRMGILYYRNLNKELYFDRLQKWHSTCAWWHHYYNNEKKETIQFFGAPSLTNIAYGAYGEKANKKVIKAAMERLISCILDDREIPRDIITATFNRASNPVAFEKWEWEKTLSIACALINKEEGYPLALDPSNHDRDYLFGRLLAVADVLERRVLDESEDKRATNAIRYMNTFAKYPAKTWKIIQECIQPYQARLGKRASYLSGLIDEIGASIKFEDFNDESLSGKYLLGFYSQRRELYLPKDKNKDEENEG